MSKPGRPCYQKPLSARRKRELRVRRKLEKREREESLNAVQRMRFEEWLHSIQATVPELTEGEISAILYGPRAIAETVYAKIGRRYG